MPTKRGFRGVWSKGVVLCLVFSVTLLATAPLMAQDKSLEKQLEEAKAAIEDQQWVIRQLDANFLKIVAELKEELDFLRALSGKQLEEIDSYLKEMQSIKLAGEAQAKELAQLEAMKEEQARRLGKLEAAKRAQQAKERAELELAIEEKAAKVTDLEAMRQDQAKELAQLEAMRQEQAKKLAQLEAIKAEQAEQIERINTLFDKATDKMQAEIDSLNTKNAELAVAKDDLQTRLNVIEMKYSKLTEEYEGQLLIAEMLRDGYSKTLGELAEKDREIAVFNEEMAKLDTVIASLEADAAKLEAANTSLRRQRLLLGLGFIIAAYFSCQH